MSSLRSNSISDRLHSFGNFEAHQSSCCVEDLAKAGFWFIESQGLVQCIVCKLQWKSHSYEHPLGFHKRLSPSCPFILDFMSLAFTKLPIRTGPRNLRKRFVKTPWRQLACVKPLFEMGFNEVEVRSAIEVLDICGIPRK